MDKNRIFDLIKKSLRIKHKLKVFESMSAPDTHEELATLYVSKWELEDELQAIEQQIQELRIDNVHHYKKLLAFDEKTKQKTSQREIFAIRE